ncbi:non-hydrolyzing UDP-N-acetylglucosamine 2-epimerase [Polynucleobacter difficilis]|uniref:non-hydrolyzing UDP-N-acetylglucosamine 2-epimerase n=1 Tax=Polynucleobacter difficilis TaxID=556054 RepID=UPI00131F0ADE|nr:UDP-N-acetylglucosamine 2-epimerase (non-hydrolyzing) [Polynucleobacter difficilis]
MNKKIMTIVGARPQFIKAAPVSFEISERNGLEEVLVHTGQHFDDAMSGIFFRELGLPQPNFNLGISNMAHGDMIGSMLIELTKVIGSVRPDMVLVYGDTNSTLAGALAARKCNIPVAHVEGGLRNYDLSIPEDTNRVLTDRISDIIFYSTNVAFKNLEIEGFLNFPVKIYRTDDLLTDAIKLFKKYAKEPTSLIKRPYILATIHRESNTSSDSLKIIINALNLISKDCNIYFPCHYRTKKAIKDLDLSLSGNIHCVEPLGYLEMLYAIENSKFVITDSGGLQREAYLFNKKSLLLMGYTPWEELVDGGYSMTSEINSKKIASNYFDMNSKNVDFSTEIYGSGKGAKKIVDVLFEVLNEV